ncbi:MAG: UDP-N-acetylmuramate dehydrogenase [Deltaproteobacteria bacterium]|nr:UDP-N-acetylmuramate dehydrogenase [Deltaproteobacteria bacterium]
MNAASKVRGRTAISERPPWAGAIEAVARGKLSWAEPMARRTTLGVGGPADLFYEPDGPETLVEVLSVIRRERIPYTVVGGGSNLLVGDGGIRGLTLHLSPEFGERVVRHRGKDTLEVTFPAGTPTGEVRRFAREEGVVGPEFLIGIPGSLGGALQMNAGTRLGEMVDVVVHAQVAHPEGLLTIPAADLRFAYREATLPPGGIVTSVTLAFHRAGPEEVAAAQAEAEEELGRRRRTQPRGRSAGSVFKNPPGDYAGRLIEEAGLKGRTVGDAQVSEVHANFIINRGKATSAQVLKLIELCRREVRARSGIGLELEVRLLGEF